MLPNELAMFSVIDFDGFKLGVYHVPRHLEAADGVKAVEPISTETFSVCLSCVCTISSHFSEFSCKKFSARKLLMTAA
jgi:hypothetical protein